MAEVIQFHCPACGTMLRLPLELAAQKGPCPECDREIIAPDPYRGIGALEAPAAVAFAPPEALPAFADSPPLVPRELEIMVHSAPPEEKETPVIPETIPAAPENKVPAGSPKTTLVLSCLLSFAVALAMGYALGVRTYSHFTSSPPTAPVIPPVKEIEPIAPVEPPPPAPAPEPAPVPEKPAIEETKAEIPKPEPPKEAPKPEAPVKASAAAEASLRAFLEAPDWATRNAHVLFPEAVRSAMEAYSHVAPDGPTPFKSIAVKQSQTDDKTGNTLFIFQVDTEAVPTGIPVAVAETPKGWLVDWQTFVEFRDDLFKKFADGPAGQKQRFHLIVSTPPPARAAKTENENFASFLLDPPLPGRQQIAFVLKNSEAYQICQAATDAGGIFTPVLEVTKLNTPEGQGYLQILEISATDWIPKGN